ncbi:hypothetical protein WQ54_08590 [Bacillus sp. SA1-12]|uniref:hypothetical protein n=1 Tax=Bacillus sp. SA1-12 TaxID=1455638 RepID=UPI0006266D9E|nr:hypothetical protein [Bacillus sp. SA1-12]KKI92658.1 hypothetical protein WQ54_08590 [Bacillus sp. SA1-12]
MVSGFLGYLLYGNILLLAITYMYLLKIRKLIGFQLGMNITNMAGGFLAIITGVILIYQFPLQFVYVTIFSTFIGMLAGALFGGLFDYQTLLTGYANGLMMGLMAPMIGAAAKTNVIFLSFLEGIFLVSLLLFVLSARHT